MGGNVKFSMGHPDRAFEEARIHADVLEVSRCIKEPFLRFERGALHTYLGHVEEPLRGPDLPEMTAHSRKE